MGLPALLLGGTTIGFTAVELGRLGRDLTGRDPAPAEAQRFLFGEEAAAVGTALQKAERDTAFFDAIAELQLEGGRAVAGATFVGDLELLGVIEQNQTALASASIRPHATIAEIAQALGI
jgi:hypothetical protein